MKAAIPDDRFGTLPTLQCFLGLATREVAVFTGHQQDTDVLAARPAGFGAIVLIRERTGLIERGALVAALRAARPGAAAVDVSEDEPVCEAAHALLTMDNVICTPHIGYVTREEWDLQFTDVFDQVAAFARGEPINIINPEVLTT